MKSLNANYVETLPYAVRFERSRCIVLNQHFKPIGLRRTDFYSGSVQFLLPLYYPRGELESQINVTESPQTSELIFMYEEIGKRPTYSDGYSNRLTEGYKERISALEQLLNESVSKIISENIELSERQKDKFFEKEFAKRQRQGFQNGMSRLTSNCSIQSETMSSGT